MKPARKPVATGMSDIETIDPPDELPSPQPNKGDTISPIGTIYIEAQVKPDYTGNVAKVCDRFIPTTIPSPIVVPN